MEQMLRLSSNIQIFRSRCYIATQLYVYPGLHTLDTYHHVVVVVAAAKLLCKNTTWFHACTDIGAWRWKAKFGNPKGEGSAKNSWKSYSKTTVPSPSWLIWKHPIAWTIDQKMIKKCAKIGIFISGMSMSFLSKKVLHQSWHWNFKGVGGIRVHHDCRKRDWRAISSHVELEWLNEATALWLIFSLQNEETAKQETPLSCWWGILANRVLFHVVS